MSIQREHLIWVAWAVAVVLALLGTTAPPLKTWPLVNVVLMEIVTILGLTLLVLLIYKKGL